MSAINDAGRNRQTVQTACRLAECSRKWRLWQETSDGRLLTDGTVGCAAAAWTTTADGDNLAGCKLLQRPGRSPSWNRIRRIYSLKIWPLVVTILMTFLEISWPNGIARWWSDNCRWWNGNFRWWNARHRLQSRTPFGVRTRSLLKRCSHCARHWTSGRQRWMPWRTMFTCKLPWVWTPLGISKELWFVV